MSYQDILYNVKDSIATITINRPKVLNAFTGDTIKEMEHALDAAAADPAVGVIVLTGVGERAFCVGGDVNWEKGASDGDSSDSGLKDLEFNFNHQLLACPKPVICRVNGYAIGAGNHIAYFCDVTIAAEHAIMGQNGPRVGSPAGGYIVAHAANCIGHKRAREMWMFARRYSAQTFMDWGLVNAVVPMAELDAEVEKWAKELLALSPTCLKILKRSFYHHAEPILGKDMTHLVEEVAPNYFETGEQLEGANAFLEKRTPDFTPFR